MSEIVRVSHEDPVLRTFVLFMQVASAVYKYVDSRFYHGSRLTTPKFVALTVLISNGGTMTNTELANWTNTKRHNITALVDRMDKDGFVTTQRRPEDKRYLEISITDKGRTVQKETRPVARQIMQELMRVIGQNDALELERLLMAVKTNIEQNSEKKPRSE